MWINRIKEKGDQPIVLFGNKADRSAREVTVEEVKSLAEKYDLVYFETSAKNNMNIIKGFDYIVDKSFEKIKECDKYKYLIEIKKKKKDKLKCAKEGI